MLTITPKYINKTKSFLLPLLIFNSYYSNPSSSAKILINPSLVGTHLPNPSSDSKEIAASFKDWFRTSKNPNFDRIFKILSIRGDEVLAISAKEDSDWGLGKLDIKLSESFVLEVLNYKKDDILSCLKFFDWCGRQPYFNHTLATCVALFKILSRAKLQSLMLDLLDSFKKQRKLHTIRFNDMLVVGYALAGKVYIALQVYGKMRFHGLDLDSASYHILLNSLVEEGCFDEMNVVLDQIRRRGYEDKFTHSIVIKSLCKQCQLDEAEEYLRGLLSRVKVLPHHAIGILVEAFCKSGRFSCGAKLIQEFGEMEGVPVQEAYGIWIKCLALAGKTDTALKFLNDKKSVEGYIPDAIRYNILIFRLLKKNQLKEVSDLLLDMKENRIVPDKVTMNAVLCFFCKAGMMDVALELYELRTEFGFTPHSLMFNYVINTLCSEDNIDEAFQMLKNLMQQGYIPGKRTFSILADALCRQGRLDEMKDLFMFALERKLIPSDSAYEKFIRSLCRAKRVQDGYLLHGEFNRLNKTPSKSTYSYLIYGFNHARRGDLAARLLIEMQEKGHTPSDKLFKYVLRCVCQMDNPERLFLHLLEIQCSRKGYDQRTFNYFIYGAGAASRPDLGRGVYDMMLKSGIVPNVNSEILMLRCYLRSGKIADALNFFEDVKKRKMVGRKIYTTMVIGLCKSRKADSALAMLKQARENGLVPSLFCYETLIKLCCSETKYDEAVQLIKEMEKIGRKVSSFVGNLLMLHSLYDHNLYKAWLRSSDQSNEKLSHAMLGQVIATFSGHVNTDAKAEDLEELVQNCFPLDLYSYNMMLRKLSINNMDEACRLFKRMCRKGYQPNRWSYDTIVHGFYMHGRKAEAQLWADEMLWQGYAPTECTRDI
ncbi:pentatricopeptide repeat-containing protein At1g71210, mitochondrial-like [Amaranthus tricolor]|uniref:pentatricopeptide repeat-containing protein At1g71210, mitochondrial-like n=1 Tax=Amaranthus tricolor TaxID=29722 RepID=UPI002584C3B2|nr:pentatricopeptide repeat-containing protein At1g71210, mitochondrial-like [Amaranthus tricolor]